MGRLNKISKELTELRKKQQEASRKGNDEKARQIRQMMNDLSKKALQSSPSAEKKQKEIDSLLRKLRK